MTALVTSVLLVVVSALLGGAVTYFTARRDLQLRFDESLRNLRIDAYKELWKTLERLAKYGRSDALSKAEAQQLRAELRTWYFHTGGLFLSTQTREDYFALLDGLELVIAGSENILREQDDEFLRVLGSRLRTAMTRDVGTRRTFVFREDAERHRPRMDDRTFVDEGGTARLAISTATRARLARLLKLPRALAAGEPTFELPYRSTRRRWDAARRELEVRVPDGEERLFLLEDTHIVEGPKGWRRGDVRRRRPSVIWRQSDELPPPAT